MAEPPALPGEKPSPKPRSSAPLAAGVALLLGLPLAGFALKAWGPLLFAPDEAPSPVVEISGPRRRSPPAAPAEDRPSSLDMIRRAPLGESAAPAPAPAPAAPTPPARPPAPAKPAPVVPARKPSPPAPKPYPKLKPNHGWLSWFARQPLQPTPDPEQDPNIQYQLPQAPEQAAAPAAAVSPPSVPAPAPAPKPAKQGYRPPAPVYTVANQATEISPGAGHGTLDVQAAAPDRSAGKPVWTEHSTFVNPPDKSPEPNPEKPRADDGACPRRGWWKSPYTGLCYYSHASCNASDYEHRGCFQPNP